jgi:hypothetical protein
MLQEILHVCISEKAACGSTRAEDEGQMCDLALRIIENIISCRMHDGCSIESSGSTFTITGPQPKLERIARWLTQTRESLVIVVRGWDQRG